LGSSRLTKVRMFVMPSDGFVAGPDQSERQPLGVGGEELHQWLLPLAVFREPTARLAAR
jgi:hypothetical protein